MPGIGKLVATIAAGQSLSNAVAIGGNFVVGLVMPPAWTPARLTIQVSPDGVAYHDMYTFYDLTSTTPTEFKANVVPGAIIATDPDTMLMAHSIKLRSGTRDEPVAQEAARQFTVIIANKVTVMTLPAEESA